MNIKRKIKVEIVFKKMPSYQQQKFLAHVTDAMVWMKGVDSVICDGGVWEEVEPGFISIPESVAP